MNPWEHVRQLFEVDDGSLPDIYVENLTKEQIVAAYEWVMSQCSIGLDPTLWSIDQERDIPIRQVQNPAREYVAGRVESFRHSLMGLSIGGIVLPQLTVCVEDGGISFDYRMGNEWNEETVCALFEFLGNLKALVPNARIYQADEGGSDAPNIEFSEAFEKYERPPSNNSLQGRRP